MPRSRLFSSTRTTKFGPAFALLLPCALTAMACSAPNDDVETSEDAWTLNPTDEELLGSVVVRSPVGGDVYRYVVKIDETPVAIDQANRIVEGKHVLSLEADPAFWGNTVKPAPQRLRIDVKRKQTTSIVLSALSLDVSVADASEGDLNVAPVTNLRVDYANPDAGKKGPEYCTAAPHDCMQTTHSCQGNSWGGIRSCDDYQHNYGTYASREECQAACKPRYSNTVSTWCAETSNPSCTAPPKLTMVSTSSFTGPWAGSGKAVAVLPGQYETSLGEQRVSVTVAPGVTQAVSVRGASVVRGAIQVTPPETRDYPDATGTASLEVGMNAPGRNLVTVGRSEPRKLTVVGYSDTPDNAYAKLGPRRLPLTLHAGKTLALTLGRIDMGDVSVTREDGTVFKARGTFTVTCTDDNAVIGTFATSSGIDVLPGNYRIDVSYSTAEGPKKKTYNVTF